MSRLYTHLAKVYHEMYLAIFDYQKEFRFYDRLLKKYDRTSLLEIGCGSGNLYPYFAEARYSYVGLDIADEMIFIARKNHPRGAFLQGDMRELQLSTTFQTIIITGRSFAYMTTNEDVQKALASIHETLKDGGLLIFDNFKADEILPNLKEGFTQDVKAGDTVYKRVNEMRLNLETGFTWDWNATYHIKEKGKKEKVEEDQSTLRAFTEDELKLFLTLNGFEVLEVVTKGTFTTVARKVVEQKEAPIEW